MHTALRILAVLLALLLGACAGEELPAAPATASSTSSPLDVPERCGTVLSPDATLLTETEAAAARWSQATGCPVTIGEGGTRIRLVSEIVDAEGAPVVDSRGMPRPGFTHYGERGELIIEVTSARTVGLTLPHEIGHVLNPREGHVAGETALMCHDGGDGLITAADLDYICEGYRCEAYVSEV